MSKKRPTESGWESDEDDLLTVNDGGISAFRMQEEDEIDEAALLGLDDSAGFDPNAQHGQTGTGGAQASYEQPDMLEIELDEEEVLDYEDDTLYSQDVGNAGEDEGAEYHAAEGDMTDDMQQAETHDVSQTESHDYYEEHQQEEAQEFSQEEQQSSSYVEASHEAEQAESESDSNSDGEGERLRFKSERPNIISLAKAKSRTDIPDTLEITEEQQAQIDKFDPRQQKKSQRGRSRGNRKRGPRGNRDDRQSQGGPIPQGPFEGRPGQQGPGQFHQEHRGRGRGQFQQGPPMMRNQPMPLMRQQIRGQGPRFGERIPTSPRGPRPLMASPMMPPEVHFSTPSSLPPRLQQAQQERLQLVQQQQQQQIRHPRKILINPNFRGPVPGGPPVSVPTSWPGGPQPVRLMHPEGPRMIVAEAPMSAPGEFVQHIPAPGIPAEALIQEGSPPFHPGGRIIHQPQPGQPFGQPQGLPFQQERPRFGGPGMPPPGTPHGHPQQGLPHQPGRFPGPRQPQPGFGPPQEQGIPHRMPVGQGMLIRVPSSQAGVGPPPPEHLMSPHGFQEQGPPPGHPQGQFPPQFEHHQPPHQPPQHQVPPRLTSPPQRLIRGPAPHQQQQQLQQLQQQQQGQIVGRVQRRIPQKQQAVVMARKLTQQAKFTQQAKVASQNKNITVVPIVPLKRRSTDAPTSVSPVKTAKTSQPAVEEEPMDEELKKGLERQKQLREMIRKKKEANRRREAAARRKELEEKLAAQGLTLKDVEGQEEDLMDAEVVSEAPAPAPAPAQPKPQPVKRVQSITTIVTGGSQQRQQQQQKAQVRQPPPTPQQNRVQGQPGQPFQPRVPNQPGGIRPVRQQQPVTQPVQPVRQQQQVVHPPRQPFSPRQQRPTLVRQSSGQPQFQQQPPPGQPKPPQPFQQHQQFEQHQFEQEQFEREQYEREQYELQQYEQQQFEPQHYEQQQFEQQQHQEQFQRQQQHQPVQRIQQRQERFGPPQHEFPEQEMQEPWQQEQQQYQQPPPHFQPQQQFQHQQRQQQFQQQQRQPQQPRQQQQPFQQRPRQQQLQQVRSAPAAVASAEQESFDPQYYEQQQSHIVGEAGDGFPPQQNTGGRGRGIFARIGAQPNRGRGVAVVRGQGVASARGRGVTERGRGVSSATPSSPRQVVSLQQHQQESERTVLPARGRGQVMGAVSRGGAAGNRVVVPQGQRQVMRGGAVTKVQKVAGPTPPTQVSIDNLPQNTSIQDIKKYCKGFGEPSNILMIPSQKKVIVSFNNRMQALAFQRHMHRRMINLSMVAASLLG